MGILIKRIYDTWTVEQAEIVERLYRGGLKEAEVSTSWVRRNFPELGNWTQWTYPERIAYYLLQPDLFPETLEHPFGSKPIKYSRHISYGPSPIQFELFPEIALGSKEPVEREKRVVNNPPDFPKVAPKCAEVEEWIEPVYDI